jgi:hypothetical protein
VEPVHQLRGGGGWSGKLSGEDAGMALWNRFLSFEGGEGGLAS